MSQMRDAFARLLASLQGRAVPVRSSFSLTPDPAHCFAIAPIKLVAEEVVQAAAFGSPDEEPKFIVRWNPLSRESSDLEPLAEALAAYLSACVSQSTLPRIWLPHSAALELVDLLAHRYRTNKQASESLRAMGWHCRVLVDESKFPGQQVVAVAGDLLRSHVATGQSPAKDGHLGALLAWLEPPPDEPPAKAADKRVLEPASGVLPRRDDDRIEDKLRPVAKAGGPRAAEARVEIERILQKAALSEWALLCSARRAFWRLGLSTPQELVELVQESMSRVHFSLPTPHSSPTQPHALARRLESYEFAEQQANAVALRSDDLLREQARTRGRAVAGSIVSVDQPRRGKKPCRAIIQSDQPVMRVRPGARLITPCGHVVVRVEAVRALKDGVLLYVDVEKGVRRPHVPAAGTTIELLDAFVTDMRMVRGKVLNAMKAAASPLVYQENLTPGTPAAPTSTDLLAIAEGFRR